MPSLRNRRSGSNWKRTLSEMAALAQVEVGSSGSLAQLQALAHDEQVVAHRQAAGLFRNSRFKSKKSGSRTTTATPENYSSLINSRKLSRRLRATKRNSRNRPISFLARIDLQCRCIRPEVTRIYRSWWWPGVGLNLTDKCTYNSY